MQVDDIFILRTGVRDDTDAEFVEVDKIELRTELFMKYMEIYYLNKELKR